MATKKNEEPAYKVGDTWPVKPGSLVRQPDGVVVTSGAEVELRQAGEYVCGEDSVTVAEAE